jgi:hypothetical protein
MGEFLSALGADVDTPTEVFFAAAEEDFAAALTVTTVDDTPLTSMGRAALVVIIRDMFERAGFEAPRLGAVPRRASPAPPTLSPATLALPAPARSAETAELDADLISLAQIVDQSSRLHARRLTYAEIADLRAVYVSTCGAPPPEEHLPSAEQLAALQALLRAGRAPYTDFAVWSPLGPRLAKFRRTEAAVLVGSAFVSRTLEAPPSFEAWEESYHLFSVAMVSLSAAAPGTLFAYLAGIRKLLRLFPGRWSAISGADLIVRSERWGRLREELEAAEPSMSPAPWDRIIAAATFGSGGLADSWWQVNLVLPLTVGAPLEHAGLPGSARGSASASHSSRPPASSRPPRAAAAAPARQQQQPQRGPTAQEKANQICNLYNSKVGLCKGEGPCSFGRRHVCAVCEAPHRAADQHPDYKPDQQGQAGTKRPHAGKASGRARAPRQDRR